MSNLNPAFTDTELGVIKAAAAAATANAKISAPLTDTVITADPPYYADAYSGYHTVEFFDAADEGAYSALVKTKAGFSVISGDLKEWRYAASALNEAARNAAFNA